jgi:hypothetical protein
MLPIGILAWTLLLPAALLVLRPSPTVAKDAHFHLLRRRGGHVRCTGLPL